jgi:hypothetical protein
MGGWTRLLVVLAVVWLFLAVAITWDGWPRRDTVHRQFRTKGLQVLARHAQKTDTNRAPSTEADRVAAFDRVLAHDNPDANDSILTARVIGEDEWAAEIDSSMVTVRQAYHRELGLFWTQQVRYLGTVFLLWSVPVCLVALVGWSIGWIYRGFRYRPVQ